MVEAVVQLFLDLIKMVVVAEAPLLVQGAEVEDLASLQLVVFVHPLAVELVVFVHPLVVELVMVLIQFLMEVVEEA